MPVRAAARSAVLGFTIGEGANIAPFSFTNSRRAARPGQLASILPAAGRRRFDYFAERLMSLGASPRCFWRAELPLPADD